MADGHESRVLELTKECQKTGQIIQKFAVSVHNSNPSQVDRGLQYKAVENYLLTSETGTTNFNSLCVLKNDLKICKEKSANYKAALIRQEEKITQQKRVLERMDEARRQLENSYDKVKRENANLTSESAELKAKLEEGRNQLQETEGMIRWLNKQV